MLRHIPALMDKGRPVSVLFTGDEGTSSPLLYCELVQKARFGESFLIRNQGCRVYAYVMRETEEAPDDYYYRSGRYRDKNAARNAVASLHRITEKGKTVKIAPYSGEHFDILILFLKPERAMRLVQAYAYRKGNRVEFITGGAASVCSECTAYPLTGKVAISPGCKGSRKHSRYPDNELVVGISSQIASEIEDALGSIPETFE